MRSRVALLLDVLRSTNSRDAWVGFLESYSPVLYQTARACTSDQDAAADCYLHICEQLARNRFRRLLKFKPEGSASFITWLRVVARNLCFDWHRSRSGRHRPFKSLQHVSQLEPSFEDRFNRLLTKRRAPTTGSTSLVRVFQTAVIERTASQRSQSALDLRRATIIGSSGRRATIDVVDPRPDRDSHRCRQQQAQAEKCVASSTDERLIYNCSVTISQ